MSSVTLETALHQASSRYSPRPVPAAGVLIHLAVLGAWIVVLYAAFRFSGLAAWSVGLLYVTYDTLLLVYVFLRSRYILKGLAKGPAAADAAPGPQPSVGVLIAARNEALALPRTLHALLAQTDPPDAILVIDDGSTDASREVLGREFGIAAAPAEDAPLRSARYPSLAVLQRPPGGKARALNAGLALIGTDVILTVDADTILDRDAVHAMRRAFAREPQLVAACGALAPVCERRGGLDLSQRFFQWFQTYEYIRAFISRIAWMRAGSLLLVSGAFAAFRCDALLTVGGFDAACLVEDYELIHRLHRWGYEHGIDWRVRVLGDARGTTDVPGTLPAFMRQRRRWFAGFLQTQWWNRDMTGNPRFGSLGRLMLPIKAIDTLQPIYGLTDGLTAFCVLVWILDLGRPVLPAVLMVIAAKIAIDLAFHLWSVHLYAVWTGQRNSRGRFLLAFLAALGEPFSFQLLRHSGAAWGWWAFLTGRLSWGTGPG